MRAVRALVYLPPPDEKVDRFTLLRLSSPDRLRRRLCRDDAVRLVRVEPESVAD